MEFTSVPAGDSALVEAPVIAQRIVALSINLVRFLPALKLAGFRCFYDSGGVTATTTGKQQGQQAGNPPEHNGK